MSEDPAVRTPASKAASGKRRPQALGRGLGALLGETRREEPLVASGTDEGRASDAAGGLAMLAIADIEPNPDQPRRNFDEAALDELAASISQRGVIQPIIVRRA